MEAQAAGNDLMEALKELESLELTLMKEREFSAQLQVEKQNCEDMHQRDVAMLEKMLQQALSENEDLRKQLSAARGGLPEEPISQFASPAVAVMSPVEDGKETKEKELEASCDTSPTITTACDLGSQANSCRSLSSEGGHHGWPRCDGDKPDD
eukprot:TRINITY_DN11277_c0_g1_i1.p1 TRINITY_DN11277_c0_g1~~TRINITY_DN11277_c0_g1_i1.p1  ORF type:complete len:153 (-),score=47.52 TRINITY_DN11277_c0_g1_i1:95-553(-)